VLFSKSYSIPAVSNIVQAAKAIESRLDITHGPRPILSSVGTSRSANAQQMKDDDAI
jgi:hypothetical protein